MAYVCKETLSALEFIHSRQVSHQLFDFAHAQLIHRDLKSDNLLFSDDGVLKLSDFGFSVQLTDNRGTRNTVVGTVLSIFFPFA